MKLDAHNLSETARSCASVVSMNRLDITSAVPSGLEPLLDPIPTLKRWAIVDCPSGTGKQDSFPAIERQHSNSAPGSHLTPHASRLTLRAFTLIEIMLAAAIFSIILVAINTVFFAAIRLRQRTTEMLEESLPLNQALTFIRRDLQNAMPPGGVLAGNFSSGGPSGTSATGVSKMTSGASLGGSQNGGLDFYTTTGHLSDDAPWGDIQEVSYQLVPALENPNATGKDLVRTVTRNLLATATQTAEAQRLAGNIASLDFFYYDGTQWRDTWDTSAGDTGLPAAVRVRLQPATPDGIIPREVQPLEMVVLLDTQSPTNTTQTAGATQ